MRHAFVDIASKTMCSRCGNEVTYIDEECPAISDGEMYAMGNREKIPSDLPRPAVIFEGHLVYSAKQMQDYAAAAVVGERERILALLPGGQICDPQQIADAIRANN